MQREFPEQPIIGVGAIIVENSSVLLVKRAHPPIQGEWSIPGGALEIGELVREAAVREAREETGLTVEPRELLGVFDRVLRDPEQRVQYLRADRFPVPSRRRKIVCGQRCRGSALVLARRIAGAESGGRYPGSDPEGF